MSYDMRGSASTRPATSASPPATAPDISAHHMSYDTRGSASTRPATSASPPATAPDISAQGTPEAQ